MMISSSIVQAQSLAQWTFENIRTAVPIVPIEPSSHSWKIDVAFASITGGNNNGSPDICSGAETWSTNFWPTTTYKSSGEYLQFKATVRAGYDMHVTGLSLRSNISSLSAARWFEVYCSTDDFRTDSEYLGKATNTTSTLCGTYSFSTSRNVAEGGSVTFRVYPYGQDVAAQAATMRIDNVTILGTAALPVTLMSWDGEVEESRIRLQWSTSNEVNHDFFVVERRLSNGQFVDLGKIKQKNVKEATNTYVFYDQAPLFGNNVYRLKQVDQNGDVQYSKLISITYKSTTSLKVFPTVFNTSLNIQTTEDAQAYIFDTNGYLLLEIPLKAFLLKQIDMQRFKKGWYVVKVFGKGFSSSERIFKL